MELIVSLCGSLGVTGTLVWYLYWTTTKTIPDLTEKHANSMDKITDKFSDTLREEREFRRAEFADLKTFIKAEGCKHQENKQ
jgi:hypothetical protein